MEPIHKYAPRKKALLQHCSFSIPFRSGIRCSFINSAENVNIPLSASSFILMFFLHNVKAFCLTKLFSAFKKTVISPFSGKKSILPAFIRLLSPNRMIADNSAYIQCAEDAYCFNNSSFTSPEKDNAIPLSLFSFHKTMTAACIPPSRYFILWISISRWLIFSP